MEEKIRTLGSLHALHFSAHLDRVRLRTDKVTERIRIEHPEAAAVLPFLDARHVLMVRQWRYALSSETLEIPAGKADPGESLEVCARRELLEETGYEASRLIPLFTYYPAIGYSNEIIRIFAASGLGEHTRGHVDVDEISRVEVVALDHLLELILQGEVRDGKTVIALSMFQHRQAHGGIPSEFFQENSHGP